MTAAAPPTRPLAVLCRRALNTPDGKALLDELMRIHVERRRGMALSADQRAYQDGRADLVLELKDNATRDPTSPEEHP